tara:strand:+ start:142 stop:498 length:357 start_codon:yes stop_codon:yes gene_type:complete
MSENLDEIYHSCNEAFIDFLGGFIGIREEALNRLLNMTPLQRYFLAEHCKNSELEELSHIRKLQNSIKRYKKIMYAIENQGVDWEKLSKALKGDFSYKNFIAFINMPPSKSLPKMLAA